MVPGAGLALVFALTACGGAQLSHTVPDEQVSGFVGPAKARLDTSRAAIVKAEKRLADSRLSRKTVAESVQATVARGEKAEKDAASAEQALEHADERLEAALEQAGARKKAAVTAAEQTHEREVAAARRQHNVAKRAAGGQLAAAERAQAVEEARKEYEEARLGVDQARVEAGDAELWVARARYEQTKFEELGKVRGDLGAAYQARLAGFQEQVSQREVTFTDKRNVLRAANSRARSAKVALDELLNAKTTGA